MYKFLEVVAEFIMVCQDKKLKNEIDISTYNKLTQLKFNFINQNKKYITEQEEIKNVSNKLMKMYLYHFIIMKNSNVYNLIDEYVVW